MSKILRTPIIKPRTQGGTFYTFGSALEDIGLNINENRNKVEISHYILLDIPYFDSSYDGSDGHLHLGNHISYGNDSRINEGDMMFAEGFENYCLNMETIVRNQDNYNFASNKTVSERVFWKWLFKDRLTSEYFDYDPNSGYYYEKQSSSITKAFGAISAGSQRTDDNGIYNETFVQIPSSYGQMKILFKRNVDENYTQGSYVSTTENNIENIQSSETQNITKCSFTLITTTDVPSVGDMVTIQGTTIQLVATKMDFSSKKLYCETTSNIESVSSTGTLVWTNTSGVQKTQNYNDFEDIVSGNVLKTTGISSLAISDSSNATYAVYTVGNDSNIKSDMFEAELDITKLRTYYNNSTLSYDDIGMGKVADSDAYMDFSFNAILVYYSVYNANGTKRLATNAYGLYILDNALESNDEGVFYFPSLNKIQATNIKQGSSYSFRINIKPSTAYSGDVQVNDNSTVGYSMSEDFTDVLRNLSSAVNTMKANAKLLYEIKKEDDNIKNIASQAIDKISDIENDINAIKNGGFPYTADEIFRRNPSNVVSVLTPSTAKEILDAMTVTYTADGNLGTTIDTSLLKGNAYMIGEKMKANMNNNTYYDMLAILQVLVARSKVSYVSGEDDMYKMSKSIEKISDTVDENTESINNMGTSITQLSATVEDIDIDSSQIQANKVKIAALDSSLTSYKTETDSDIDNLSRRVTTNEGSITRVNSSIGVINSSITTLLADITETHNDIIETNENLNNTTERVLRTENTLLTLSSDISTMKSDMVDAKSEIDDVDHKTDDVSVELATAKIKTAQIERTVNDIIPDVSGNKVAILAIGSSVYEIDQDLIETKDRLSVAEIGVNEAKDDASSALRLAGEVKDDASSALRLAGEARIIAGDAKDDASSALRLAGDARIIAGDAKDDASSALRLAGEARIIAGDAKDDASSALRLAGEVKDDVSSALRLAGEARIIAGDAKDDVSVLSDRIDAIDSSIGNLEREIQDVSSRVRTVEVTQQQQGERDE